MAKIEQVEDTALLPPQHRQAGAVQITPNVPSSTITPELNTQTKQVLRGDGIEVWQLARELVSDIYRCSRAGSFRRDPSLRDQLRRAAISVPANVAEGFGRKTNKDFANFLYIAKGSATEVISHLYLALDQGYLERETFDTLKSSYQAVLKKLINFIRYLESKPGTRFS